MGEAKSQHFQFTGSVGGYYDSLLPDGSTAPAAPTITLTAVSQGINVNLSAFGSGSLTFTLQRATNASFTTGLSTLSSSLTSISFPYVDSSLSAGTYYYRLSATGIGGASNYSATVTTSPIYAPSISASRVDNTTIRFTFTGGSGATSWTGYYRTPSGAGSYTPVSLTVGQAYYDVTVASQSTANFYIASANATGAVNSNIASGSASGALLFSDTMDSGYTATTSWSSFVSQFQSRGWHYIDGTDGRNSIEADPLNASRMCYAMWYYNDGNGHCIAWKSDPNHTQPYSRPTEMYVAWDEYRPADFDFGPTKDFRWTAIPGGWWSDIHDHDADVIDIYGGFAGAQGGTSSACSTAGLNIQGNGASQPGDPNTIVVASGEIMTRGTWHTVEIRIKLNTPNNSDGAAEGWVDGVQYVSRTNVKFSKDGVPQCYLDGWRMGMEATNGGGGAAFNPQRKRFTRNFRISTSRITG